MRKPQKSQNIDRAIEMICDKGCDAVNEVIVQLEAGNTPQALGDVSPVQQEKIFRALKEIMQVYQA